MDDRNDLLSRGVVNIIPNREGLQQKLTGDKPLNVYLGIDPTATRIHLGHAVALRKLQRFAEIGHHVIFLVGDFTAKIGDTSDKDGERPQLTDEQIQKNLESYKEQAGKIIDFSKVEIRFNSEWLSRLSFDEAVRLIGKFSLNDFISRELIKKRLTDGKSVGLLETIYPIMQGYDSFILDTDLQIGGTDQTFNMQAGRSLLKEKKESFIMTMEFLPGTDGRKMSKTWGNAIWLTDSAEDMYGKVMSIADEVINDYLVLATSLPRDEVMRLKNEIPSNPMEVKKHVAYAIVSDLHGVEEAHRAQEHFKKTVQDKELPSDIQKIEIDKGTLLLEFLTKNNLVPSKSEGKRLIEQGGVTVGETRATQDTILDEHAIIKVGKRIYVNAQVR